MQTTSTTWKSLFAAGARLETKAVIGDAEYTLMSNPVITRALMQGALGIGNAVSATCQLSVQITAAIPRAASVQIKMRLTDGETTSEWLPAGTFFIAKRQRDPVTGIVTLECYDAMLKANAALEESVVQTGPWIWTTGGGDQVTDNSGNTIVFSEMFPCSGARFVHYAAILLGVEVDGRTTLQTGSAYTLEAPPAGTTVHDVLCLIAAQNGGNWIITPENKLRLVPLVSAAAAESAEENVVDVVGVLSSIAQRTTATVTGIRYTADDLPVILGDESGLVIDTEAGAAVASGLYNALAGVEYQAFSLDGAIYDPAAELGDYVRAGANGEIRSILCAEVATLGALFTASISAPEGGEMSDEYPYIGGASNKALIASKVYTRAAVQSFSDSLDQESVFNRLTNNGALQGLYMNDGQLYVNMTYARSGTLVLGGLNNTNGLLVVKDSSDQEVGRWDNTGININKGSISLIYVMSNYTCIISMSPNDGELKITYQTPNFNYVTKLNGRSINIKDNDTLKEVYLTPEEFNMDVSGGHFVVKKDTSDSVALVDIVGNLNITGKINGNSLNTTNSFATADGKIVTVNKGIITSIVGP